MQIQVNTDKNIQGGESLNNQVQDLLNSALSRFSHWITRVEVHLSDENGNTKANSNDKRCLIEVRPAGLRPLNVSHEASSVAEALDAATDKIVRLLDKTSQTLRDAPGETLSDPIEANIDDGSETK